MDVFSEPDAFEPAPQQPVKQEAKPKEEAPKEQEEEKEEQEQEEQETTEEAAETAEETEETEESEEAEEEESQESEEEEGESEEESAEEESEEEEEVEHPLAETLEKAFPDRDLKTLDDYNEAAKDYIKQLEEYKERGTKANQQLIDVFDSNPEVANITKAIAKGATFREALARYVDPADLTPVEGDPDYEAWQKNLQQRKNELEEQERAAKEMEANIKASNATLKEFVKEAKISDDDAQGLINMIGDMYGDFMRGKVTKDAYQRFLKAYRYDADVKEAVDLGEKKGKNAKINEVRKGETKKKKGDGLPKPEKSAIKEDEKPGVIRKLDELVDRTIKKDVWSR
jgi:hypothetical protein